MTAAETAIMEFAYQIRRHLHENGMTTEELARKANVTEEIINQAIQEEMIPTGEMQRICCALGITMDSLRWPPTSEQFQDLQQLMLDTVGSGHFHSTKDAAKAILEALDDMAPYEQNRNLRWLRQSIEHPNLSMNGSHLPDKRQRRYGHTFREMFSHCPLTSAVCFTRKLHRRQQKKLEQIIEDSKKK